MTMRALGSKENFLGIPLKYSSYGNSKIVLLQVPLEKTVSYGKGTGKGPAGILKASHYVEFYDEESGRELCFDRGICTLAPPNLQNKNIAASLDKIYADVRKIIKDGKFAVILGGEHSLSSAPARAYNEVYKNLSVLQIDAHSDLRDSYEGSKYSHASVMARIFEFNKDIVQVGIRAQSMEESLFIKENGINTFYARDIRMGRHGKVWQNRVVDKLKENVYLTFDVDGLDPSVIPSTGTPEPGGLFWDETLDLLKKVSSVRNIVGFDVVELAPSKDSNYSSFTTAKLIYKILNYIFY